MKKLMLILLMVIVIVVPVFANGLPTYVEGNDSGMVRIDENTAIQLLEETVVYDIGSVPRDRSSYMLGINNQVEGDITAEITVTYKMRSDIEENTIMYFMLPNVDSGYITIDGVNIDETIYTKEKPDSIDWQPSSVQNYEVRYETFKTAEIPLNFEAGEEKIIEIHYIPSSGFNRSGSYVNGVFDFVYYLTPAKYWLGDAKVNLIVNMDEGLTYQSNIELEKSSEGSYGVTLDQVPAVEWYLEISYMNYRVFMTNNAWLHNFILLILFILITQLHRLLPKTFYRKQIRTITYFLACIMWYKLNMDAIGYPFGFIFVWLGYLILFLVGPIVVSIINHNERIY